jgi:hypothetical protein
LSGGDASSDYALDALVMELVGRGREERPMDKEEGLSNDEALSSTVQAVEVPEEVARLVAALVKWMHHGGLNGADGAGGAGGIGGIGGTSPAADTIVSDRRIGKAMTLLKMVALSSGRTTVNSVDCWLLQHVLGGGSNASAYEEHHRLMQHRLEQRQEQQAQQEHQTPQQTQQTQQTQQQAQQQQTQQQPQQQPHGLFNQRHPLWWAIRRSASPPGGAGTFADDDNEFEGAAPQAPQDDFEYFRHDPLLRWMCARIGVDTAAEEAHAHAVMLLREVFERFARAAAVRAWGGRSQRMHQRWVDGCAQMVGELDTLEEVLLRQLLVHEAVPPSSHDGQILPRPYVGTGVLAEVAAHPWLVAEEAEVLGASIRQVQYAQQQMVVVLLQEVRALRASIQLDISAPGLDKQQRGLVAPGRAEGGEVSSEGGGAAEAPAPCVEADEALLRLCAAHVSVGQPGVDLLVQQLADDGLMMGPSVVRPGGLIVGSNDDRTGVQAVEQQLQGLAVMDTLGWRDSSRGRPAIRSGEQVRSGAQATRHDYTEILRQNHALKASNASAQQEVTARRALSAADAGLSRPAMAMAEQNPQGWAVLRDEIFGHEREYAAAAAAQLLNSSKGEVLSASTEALREAWALLRDKVCAGDERRAAALVHAYPALLTQPAGMTELSWETICNEVLGGDAEQARAIVGRSPQVLTAPRTMMRGAWAVLHQKIFDGDAVRARAVVQRDSSVLRTTESKLMGNWRVLLRLTCDGDAERGRTLVLQDPKVLIEPPTRSRRPPNPAEDSDAEDEDTEPVYMW